MSRPKKNCCSPKTTQMNVYDIRHSKYRTHVGPKKVKKIAIAQKERAFSN